MLGSRAGVISCFVVVTGCSFDGTIIDPAGGSGGQGGDATSSGGSGAGGDPQGGGGDSTSGGGGAQPSCVTDPDCYDGNPCSRNTCNGTSCVSESIGPGEPGSAEGGCVGVCQTDGTCGLSLYSKPFGSTTTAWTRVALSEAWAGTNAPPPRDILASERTVDQDVLLVVSANGTLYRRVEGVWQPPVPLLTVFPDAPGLPVFDPTKVYSLLAWRSEPTATTHTLLFSTTGAGTTQHYFYFNLGFDGMVTAGVSGDIEPESEGDAAPQSTQPSQFGMTEQSAYIGTASWVRFWTQYGDSMYVLDGGPADPSESWTRWTPAAASPFYMPTDTGPVPSTVVSAYKVGRNQYLIAP